jgi:hypothetical protein
MQNEQCGPRSVHLCQRGWPRRLNEHGARWQKKYAQATERDEQKPRSRSFNDASLHPIGVGSHGHTETWHVEATRHQQPCWPRRSHPPSGPGGTGRTRPCGVHWNGLEGTPASDGSAWVGAKSVSKPLVDNPVQRAGLTSTPRTATSMVRNASPRCPLPLW